MKTSIKSDSFSTITTTKRTKGLPNIIIITIIITDGFGCFEI